MQRHQLNKQICEYKNVEYKIYFLLKSEQTCLHATYSRCDNIKYLKLQCEYKAVAESRKAR